LASTGKVRGKNKVVQFFSGHGVVCNDFAFITLQIQVVHKILSLLLHCPFYQVAIFACAYFPRKLTVSKFNSWLSFQQPHHLYGDLLFIKTAKNDINTAENCRTSISLATLSCRRTN